MNQNRINSGRAGVRPWCREELSAERSRKTGRLVLLRDDFILILPFDAAKRRKAFVGERHEFPMTRPPAVHGVTQTGAYFLLDQTVVFGGAHASVRFTSTSRLWIEVPAMATPFNGVRNRQVTSP